MSFVPADDLELAKLWAQGQKERDMIKQQWKDFWAWVQHRLNPTYQKAFYALLLALGAVYLFGEDKEANAYEKRRREDLEAFRAVMTTCDRQGKNVGVEVTDNLIVTYCIDKPKIVEGVQP